MYRLFPTSSELPSSLPCLRETRGFDLVEAELASVAGYVHDIAAFSGQGGIRHAEKGAEILKEVLPGLDIFSAEEIGRICTAVSRHSSKQEIHTDFDEVLKDADVLDHYFSDISHISEKDYPRMVRLNEELKLNLEFRRYE